MSIQFFFTPRQFWIGFFVMTRYQIHMGDSIAEVGRLEQVVQVCDQLQSREVYRQYAVAIQIVPCLAVCIELAPKPYRV